MNFYTKISIRVFSIVLSFLSPFFFPAGHECSAQIINSAWVSKADDEKVFIENKGQFDERYNDGHGKVLFNASDRGINMSWSEKGLTYAVIERYLTKQAQRELSKKDGEEAREEAREKARVRYHYLHMEWLGANPNPEVISEEPVSYHFTYANPNYMAGKNGALNAAVVQGFKASAYQKITYKNIYPNIDAEYILPEKGGVKYSFIVHPGADISLIKMRYTGAESVSLNSNGEIEINTRDCGNYLEHRPQTYCEGGSAVASAFSFQKGIIGFSIRDYDRTKTVIIDPMVGVVSFPNQFPATPGSGTRAKTGYDVCYDYKGNAWVFGGDLFTGFYVAKYSNTGAKLWVYAVPLGQSGGFGGGADDLVGDLEVNKSSGTAYVSQGANVWQTGKGARIYKLEPSAGTVVATYPSNKNCVEISRLRLTCDGKLYGTGGGVGPVQGMIQVFSIDTNLTTMTGVLLTTSTAGDHDSNLMTLDPSGNFMYQNFNRPAPFSADFLNDNEMRKLPLPGLTPPAWLNPGPIYSFVEQNSIAYAGYGTPLTTNSGAINMFNGMVCGNGFLYTYNGDTIKKWDKGTGAKLGEVITPGKRYWSGGLDLDLCENVYASVSNAVNVYDPDLNFITSYPLGDTSCYDLKVDKLNNLLYATGVGYVKALKLSPPVLQLTSTVTPSGCGGCNGTASANISCNKTAFLYKWLPGGQTTSTITGLCPNTYTVIATADITCAKTIGDTAIVIVPAGGGVPPTATVNSTNASCSDDDGTGTVTASGGTSPYVYSWSPMGGTNAAATGLSSGTYTVTTTDALGCSTTNTLTVASTGSLTANAISSTICAGQSATLSASGGTHYFWSTGAVTSVLVINPTAAASYTVLVSDNNGCSGLAVASVDISAPPVAVAANATVCSGQHATLSASGGGSYSWSTGNTTAAIDISPVVNTTYTVVVSFGSCSDTTSASVAVVPSPTVSVGSDQTICSGQTATLDAGNSTAAYLWSTGETTQTIEVSGAGTYWVFVASNNCGARDTVSTFIAPQVQLSDSNLCTISPIVLDPGSGANSYLWSNGSTTQTISVNEAGNFWVVALFGSCMSGDSATITGDGTGGAIYIPNAFTPNDDDLNEVFQARGTGIATFDMNVFDRWGNLLFTSNNINTGWNGKIEDGHYPLKKDGEEASQEDVYIWKVDYTTQCFPGMVKRDMGVVSIVR